MKDNFYELYRYRERIDAHLEGLLPEIDSKSRTLLEAMRYTLGAKGKRIRPILLLLVCESVGGDVQAAIPYACAIEFIHAYSLIHDDLPAMDDDDLRRGEPTNHKVFGEGMAILAGDGLLSAAFELIHKEYLIYLDQPEALRRRIRAGAEIAKGCGCRGMVAGQAADLEAEGRTASRQQAPRSRDKACLVSVTCGAVSPGYAWGRRLQKHRILHKLDLFLTSSNHYRLIIPSLRG
jgi:geranylgeranyl diphosphate synthase type II